MGNTDRQATEGMPAELTILDQVLQGSFVFEMITNSLGERNVRLGASDVSVILNAGGTDVVSLTPTVLRLTRWISQSRGFFTGE